MTYHQRFTERSAKTLGSQSDFALRKAEHESQNMRLKGRANRQAEPCEAENEIEDDGVPIELDHQPGLQ